MAKKKRPTRRVRHQERQTNWVLIGGIIIGAVAVLGLLALALSEPTGTESAPLSLSDYCAANPESCIVEGAPDAPVTVVEVSDYSCSHCRNFNLDTAGLLRDLYVTPGDVQWVTLPYAARNETVPPARAAMCANEQGRFAEFHHQLFEMQDQLGVLINSDFEDAAAAVNLDADAFEECYDGLRYNQTVLENSQAANEARVTGTPTFFVNGVILEGNQPLTAFQQTINNALAAANAN